MTVKGTREINFLVEFMCTCLLKLPSAWNRRTFLLWPYFEYVSAKFWFPPMCVPFRSKPSPAAFVGCMMPFMLGVCFLCPSMDCLWHKYHYCPSCNQKVADFEKSDFCLVMDPPNWEEKSFALPAWGHNLGFASYNPRLCVFVYFCVYLRVSCLLERMDVN